jgi:hypothetical protein
MSANDYDVELYEAIKDLTDEGHLVEGTPAHGIAQQVIHMGYDTLTPKQRAVYDAIVVPALEKREQEVLAIRHRNSADYISG